MMSVTCTLCPLARDYTGLILYAVGFGAFDGCFVLLIAITTSDIVGPGKLPQALGGLYGVIAFPMIFGPPLAGMCALRVFLSALFIVTLVLKSAEDLLSHRDV